MSILGKETEQSIERLILDYLDRIKNGYVMKINMSGKPIRRNGVITMVPFASIYCRRGVSDITFIWHGLHHAFEVKTPSEHKWIINNKKKLYGIRPELLKNKKHKHIREQMIHIENIIASGGVGAFVSSLDHVKNILIESKKRLVEMNQLE